MIKLLQDGVFVHKDGSIITQDHPQYASLDIENCKKNTIAHEILQSHNQTNDMTHLKIRFDAMASHDITYVGIIQTAKASGLDHFPMPYVLTNCHNSLCSVGGTINEDDHVFGLSAAKKYGGIYVPPHMAVIHSYMREKMAGCGKMILGSDSHTRYGALGTMAIGEGGGELAKQLLNQTYDLPYPDVVAVYLTGKVHPGVGPHDVALSIVKAVFESGFVKNKVMEFIGDGIQHLSMDFRNGIDVMTTETTCLTSIWKTDTLTEEYLTIHGRKEDYKSLSPKDTAYYDGLVYVDLSQIKPMIAMPFHPSNVYSIDELNQNIEDILALCEEDSLHYVNDPKSKLQLRNKIKNNQFYVDQGIIAGCSGGIYENICAAASILGNHVLDSVDFTFSVYPDSQPCNLALMKNGILPNLISSGAIVKTAFCGPCFGAGDIPSNGSFSIRHTTRNFPSRDGSKPTEGQMTGVALMDARSIAATALRNGVLTPATEIDTNTFIPKYFFDSKIYESRCYDGVDNPQPETPLVYGPNIADWPEMAPLANHVLLKVASYITDPVTTTDELIPSGETSSYRSNPIKLAEFTLSRKDPRYVANAKEIHLLEKERRCGDLIVANHRELQSICQTIETQLQIPIDNLNNIGIGSVVYANKPGDGSAREQAASCQKVLGGLANIAKEYATKRYRSNLINWGLLPLITKNPDFQVGDYIFIPNIRTHVENNTDIFTGYRVSVDGVYPMDFTLLDLTEKERSIILDGCLINYNKANRIK